MSAGSARTANNGGPANKCRPMAGTQEFLNRGRVCLGPICTQGGVAPNGLTKTPESFQPGDSVCRLCRDSMPEEKPVKRLPPKPGPCTHPAANSPRYMPRVKKVEERISKPVEMPKTFGKVEPSQPLRTPAQIITEAVKSELALVLPEMVKSEIRRLFRNATKEKSE